MRISGIILLFLAVGHVLIMHVLDTGVDRVNFAFIQLRWASPFWKTWDWLMLVLALLHGSERATGHRARLRARPPGPGWRSTRSSRSWAAP